MEIHYRYWIGILVALLIGALTVHWADIKDLSQLLSFGLSLASLVLAVVAIFQSIFSSSAMGQVGVSVSSAADQVRQAASNIGQASNALLHQAKRIHPALGEITTRFENVEKHLLVAKSASSFKSEENIGSQERLKLVRVSTRAVGTALYIADRAFRQNRSFRIRDFIKSEVLENYIEGVLMALDSVGMIDASRSPEGDMKVVSSFIDEVDLNAHLRARSGEPPDAFLSAARLFFEETSSA